MSRRPPKAKPAERETVFFGVNKDINTGAVRLTSRDVLHGECRTPQQAFTRARKWAQENWFVQQVNDLKLAFYHYGFRLTAKEPKDRAALKTAWDNDAALRLALTRYVNEVQTEFLLNDTVVSFWREEAKTTPFLLLGENCEYTDAMGHERLKVTMNYKPEDLEGSDITPKQRERYTSGKQVLLSEEFDEYYSVLTRAYRGQGFGFPRLQAVFQVLQQNQSMEAGENSLALCLRKVERFHRFGWEQKATGMNQTKQTAYATWTKKRWDAVLAFYNGRYGAMETSGNFDHFIELLWGGKGFDVKWFDARKWETITQRLMWWGGPLAFMMVSKAVNPFLLGMLKTQAKKERELVGGHLEYTLARGFNLKNVQVRWSNRCFHDARLAWDMVKTLMTQGPLSLKTGLEEGDFDPDTEAENKIEEAKETNRSKLIPIFDPAHGGKPGENNGRPPEKDKGGANPSGPAKK